MVKSGWLGSNIHDHIDFLHATRRFPHADNMGVHLPPEWEISPRLEPYEYIVFRAHFLRDFGLPAIGFFRSFLDFYRMQPHHLTHNTMVLIAAIVTFCEGYLGVLPTIELWGRFFYLKLGTAAKDEPAQCGACIVVRRSGASPRFSAFPST